MRSSPFFKLFPPPKFLVMSHSGLEISDDALRLIEYRSDHKGLSILKHDSQELPAGLMDGGEIEDEKKFVELLSDFARKNGISYAKVSLSEEKAYLFQTDIPSLNIAEITQNVEFKLEENVPLPAGDGIFYFDILPASVTGGTPKASVSVVSREYVEKIVTFLHQAGVTPVAFEVVPKAIARSIISSKNEETLLVIHIMNNKTGIYIISGGVVCFSSTISTKGFDSEVFDREISRVSEYWAGRADIHSPIARIVFVGHGVSRARKAIESTFSEKKMPASIADPWSNIFGDDTHSVPITKADSLEYVVAAGLALPV